MSRIDAETIDRIRELRTEGLTKEQVMERIGVSHHAVSTYQPDNVPRAAGWLKSDIEALKRLWMSGMSADQVAAALPGNRSRSAILGKVHRLDLQRDPAYDRVNRAHATGNLITGASARPSKAQRRAAAAPASPDTGDIERPTLAAVASVAPPETEAVDLPPGDFQPRAPQPFAERRPAQCAWPIESDGGLLACCDPVSPRSGGRQWCEHHTRRGQQKASTLQKKKAREHKYDHMAMRRWS